MVLTGLLADVECLVAPEQGWLGVPAVGCVLSSHADDLAPEDFMQCETELMSWIKS